MHIDDWSILHRRGDDQSEVYIKLELPNIQGLIIALETCKDFKVI